MDSGRVGDDAHATPCRWSSSTRAAPRKRRSHHEKAGPTRRHPSALASRLSRTVSPGGGTPPGGGDERRSTPEMISRLTLPATERPATARNSLSRPGRRVPTREAARHRGGEFQDHYRVARESGLHRVLRLKPTLTPTLSRGERKFAHSSHQPKIVRSRRMSAPPRRVPVCGSTPTATTPVGMP